MVKRLLLLLILSIALVGCGSNEANGSEEKENKVDYGTELQNVVELIISNASTAEGMIKTYSSLWSSNIKRTITGDDVQNTLNLETSEVLSYFGATGLDKVSFKGDFDTLILKLRNYYSETGKTEELETNSNEIQSKIKELNSPPTEYEKVYDKVVELYTLAEEFNQMAISPSGSLVTFNQNGSELSTEIVSKFKEIEVIMPTQEQAQE